MCLWERQRELYQEKFRSIQRERERERDKEKERERYSKGERQRERERGGHSEIGGGER